MLALTTYRLLKDNSREGLEIKSKFIHKFTFVKCEKYMDKIETLLKKIIIMNICIFKYVKYIKQRFISEDLFYVFLVYYNK
ncbi:hypothetical protein [Clostridium neonatale]|uniref:Uncharacterized protein n=1 Tax=Clostridium neonatale TaxID=137838 RepID=A0AA86JDC3_9CLOT|nr:conserved hypothetical protein [Clostridium neonatale]